MRHTVHDRRELLARQSPDAKASGEPCSYQGRITRRGDWLSLLYRGLPAAAAENAPHNPICAALSAWIPHLRIRGDFHRHPL